MITIMSTHRIELFRGLPAKRRRFESGALLFQADAPVTALFVVEDGEVHLLRRRLDGTSLILQRAGAGALVAEASLCSTAYHCDAIAVRRADVLAVAKPALLAAMAADRDLALAWLAHLAREVRTARLRAEILTLRTVAERLDAWLAEADGRLPERGSWHMLAGELGVSPEALYRELAKRRRGPGCADADRAADFP